MKELTLNDLKAATRVFGMSVDDMFDIAQRTEPQRQEAKRAQAVVQMRARR